MKIEETRQGAVTVLRPVGAVTREEADTLRARAQEAIKASMGRVVMDGSGISYLDSAGLEALLDVTEELASGGRMLKLCALNGTVRDALDLTELSQLFDFYEDINTAVRSFL